MDREVLDSLAQLMRTQRTQLLGEFRQAEEGLEAIAEERESELEEHAQEEQSARFLSGGCVPSRTMQALRRAG